MRWPAALLLGVAACGEPTAVKLTPTDRFAFPATLAVVERQSGGQALLVASGNYDLTYDGATGGTLLSVDPSDYDPVLGAGGSAGRPGGALVEYGEGAHVGSYAGQLVVVDGQTCPGTNGAAVPREVYLATRFADELWHLPLGADGEVNPCQGPGCVVPVDKALKDPFGLTLACRADGQRRSLFMSFLRTSPVNGGGSVAFLAEVDLDAPEAVGRVYPVSIAPLAGMAYHAEADQLLVLGRTLLAAPIFILDLMPCPSGLAAADCPTPVQSQVNVGDGQVGLDLQAIALSTPQPGLGRRAYVTARVYDAALATALNGRPAGDIKGVLLVLDLEPDLTGRPSFKVLKTVEIGMGASQVVVLPARDGRRDVVATTSLSDGVVAIFDDEDDALRLIPVDEATGAPEVGREPFGLAAIRLPGATPADDVARVFVAASRQQVVGIIDVPLAAPAEATIRRDATGSLIRIGGLQ